MKHLMPGFILLCLQHSIFAATPWYLNPWTASAAIGLQRMLVQSRLNYPTALARFDLGHGLYTNRVLQIGIEVGIQSGSSAFVISEDKGLVALGGLPVHAELKPWLDFLANVKTLPLDNTPVFAWSKAGLAYRQLHTARVDIQDISHWDFELQLGLGYQINALVAITLGYQYLGGQVPKLLVSPASETGILQHLPQQQALLLGLSYAFL